MKKEWSGKTKGGTFGQKSLLFYFRHGSVSLTYFILSFVVIFFMIFARKGFKSIYSYFRQIHSFGSFKSFLMTYKNHYLFGQSMLDKYALFCGNPGKYHMQFSGREAFDEALKSEKGIIIVSSHCGNFELAGYMMKQNSKKVNAIAYGGESQVYQQARVSGLSKNNISLIPVSEDFSHIYAINNALLNGEILIVPGDRVYEGSKTSEYDFMSGRAKFPDGPFLLATKYDINLFSIYVMKESAFHYMTFVEQLNLPEDTELNKHDKKNTLTTRYIQYLESIVIRYPAQWYNFYKFWN